MPVHALLLSRGGAVISAISISDGSVVRARVSAKASAVLNGRPDRCDELIGESARQRVDDGVDLLFGVCSKVFEDRAHERAAYACQFGGLEEVARHDRVYGIVTVLADSHSELEFFLLYLPRIEARLRAQYVIERGQAETSAGTEHDAEVLRVTVSRAQHPEQDACAHEGGDVLLGRIAALQELGDIAHAGAAVGLVFLRGRNGQGRADVFLWQAQQTPVSRPTAVEAFDDEGTAAPEISDLGIGRGYAEGCEQF